jgi:hypothetical protein
MKIIQNWRYKTDRIIVVKFGTTCGKVWTKSGLNRTKIVQSDTKNLGIRNVIKDQRVNKRACERTSGSPTSERNSVSGRARHLTEKRAGRLLFGDRSHFFTNVNKMLSCTAQRNDSALSATTMSVLPFL